MGDDYKALASYQKLVARLAATWPNFQAFRDSQFRGGNETEQAVQTVLTRLFVDVLGWEPGDLKYQAGFADIVVSRNTAKYLVVETKRPGALHPHHAAFHDAMNQARRYADEQKVNRIAVSDSRLLYVANITNGTVEDRIFLTLDSPVAPESLWWISEHGVYRPHCEAAQLAEPTAVPPIPPDAATEVLLHPKYQRPWQCFAYVPDANKPSTWKLPYRLMDGTIDPKRLPKAIQSLLTNYRGTKVKGIPESAAKSVLLTLAAAPERSGKMPANGRPASGIYANLAHYLQQRGAASSPADVAAMPPLSPAPTVPLAESPAVSEDAGAEQRSGMGSTGRETL